MNTFNALLSKQFWVVNMEVIFQYWYFFLGSSAIPFAIAYLFRNAISRYLTRRIEAGFDSDLESLKSDLRKVEERIRSELNARNAEIETLRNSVLVVHGERRTIVWKKRIEAAEKIWIFTQGLSEFTIAVEFVKLINFKNVTESNSKQKIMEFFELLSKMSNIDEVTTKLKEINLKAERLYLPSTVWAYFSVYRAIMGDVVMRLKYFELGLGDTNLLNEDYLREMVIELLPHSKNGFEKFGDTWAYYCLKEIHDGLLLNLQKTIEGEDDDEIDVERAAKITTLANNSMAQKLPDRIEKAK